jgi:ketosteroid isomerase-like protein
MTDNENEIRDLVVRWAAAVHAGEMDVVLDRHADDIVMFDVPPPYEGVRGLDAYRESWVPFFVWQASGALFEIVELTVHAGEDVGYAYALLKCGLADEIGPQRLRLTLGVHQKDGVWVVQHEHHSFSDESGLGEDEIRQIHEGWSRATEAKDLDAMMASIADDVVSYEHQEPIEYRGADAVRESCREGLEYGDGKSTFTTPDLTVHVAGDLAVAWGLNHMATNGKNVRSRGTRVFRRRGGRWQMIHQHVSFPVPAE